MRIAVLSLGAAPVDEWFETLRAAVQGVVEGLELTPDRAQVKLEVNRTLDGVAIPVLIVLTGEDRVEIPKGAHGSGT